MNSQKFRLILLGLLGVSIVAFTAMAALGLSTLSKKSQKLVDLKLQSKAADAQLDSLKEAKKQVAQYGYFKDIAKTVIPSDKDQAQAVLDIFQLADQSGIAIQSITFPSSSLGGAIAPAGPTGTGNAASASPSAVISQAKPVTGLPSLYSIQLTITPQSGNNAPANKQVTYAKMLDFLKRLERNRRTAQITQVTIQPEGSKSGEPIQNISFILVVNIFIKPVKS